MMNDSWLETTRVRQDIGNLPNNIYDLRRAKLLQIESNADDPVASRAFDQFMAEYETWTNVRIDLVCLDSSFLEWFNANIKSRFYLDYSYTAGFGITIENADEATLLKLTWGNR